MVTRWILKSLTTRETRSRGAQRVIEKKVEINSKNDLAQLFRSPHNFLSQDLPVVFPLRFPPSMTLRAPFSACVPNRDEWGRDRNQQQTQCSGGSRGGGRGARASPLFLDQNEGRREAPPPPLSDGLNQTLQYHMWCECCFPSLLRLNVWVFSGNSGVSLSTKLDMSNF